MPPWGTYLNETRKRSSIAQAKMGFRVGASIVHRDSEGSQPQAWLVSRRPVDLCLVWVPTLPYGADAMSLSCSWLYAAFGSVIPPIHRPCGQMEQFVHIIGASICFGCGLVCWADQRSRSSAGRFDMLHGDIVVQSTAAQALKGRVAGH